MEIYETIQKIREQTGYNKKEFAQYYGIPLRTWEDWEAGRRKPPEYVLRMLLYQVKVEKIFEKRVIQAEKNEVLITRDSNGAKLVVIPQIIFSGKRSISWDKVEEYLLRYVGGIFEVAETKDFIYIGNDFADEYKGSEYTRKLKGALPKVKANMAQGIPQMIEIAMNKRWSEDYRARHGKKAQNGWYRYNTRFALPILDSDGKIAEYNVYQAVLIVRYASDDKLYLYDIQNIKKETRYPS